MCFVKRCNLVKNQTEFKFLAEYGLFLNLKYPLLMDATRFLQRLLIWINCN